MQIKYSKGLCLMAAAAIFMLSGCSGSNDGTSTSGGTSSGTPVKASDLTAEQFAALSLKAEVSGVTINSPPVVKFKVTDAKGNPLVGLGNTSQSATATLPGYTNMSFSLAKLVPGTGGSPSKWVNYIVTTVPTYKSATDKTIVPVTATRPSTDNTGTLVDNGDGTYQYTFYRDITTIKDVVAGLTLTGNNVAADLGDLTYEPTLTHRLTIQISGNARGTGTNTSNAVQVIPGVAMKNPINIIYDFIPSTGKAVTSADTQREVTLIAKCNECHTKLAFHGGGRVDTRYCVVCHTDQRKYGQAKATSTAGSFPVLTVDAKGKYSPLTYVADGEVSGDFTVMVHKIHMGNKLTKKNYNYANVLFNDIGYPQTQLNCTKCHTKSTAAPQGDNWKSEISRLACGSCHDNIDFATGANIKATNAKATPPYTSVAHSAQTDDKNCAGCHGVGKANDHVKAHAGRIPASKSAALRTMSAKILGVTVDATTGQVTAKFTVSDNGTAVTDLTKFSKPTFILAKLVKGANGAYNWVGYTNQFNTKLEATGLVAQTKGESDGTLVANADGSFSYTFRLKTATPEGDIRNVTHAHNVAVSTKGTPGIYATDNGDPAYAASVELPYVVNYSYAQNSTHRVAMTSSKFYAPGTAPATGAPGFNAWFDFVPAGGPVTETRDIVKMANCANCHANEKIHAAFDIQVCVTCHNPDTKDPYTGETVSIENIVHKIHSATAGYAINGEDMSLGGEFPSDVKNCQVCHVETGNTDGANWRTNPTANACITCHDSASTVAKHDITASDYVNKCANCHASGKSMDTQVKHQ